jgi:hypothetical protein
MIVSLAFPVIHHQNHFVTEIHTFTIHHQNQFVTEIHTFAPFRSEAEHEEEEEEDDKGCRTKPLHLRLTAKGSFLDNVPVFPGDEKTETMLSQLFHFFGE